MYLLSAKCPVYFKSCAFELCRWQASAYWSHQSYVIAAFTAMEKAKMGMMYRHACIIMTSDAGIAEYMKPLPTNASFVSESTVFVVIAYDCYSGY